MELTGKTGFAQTVVADGAANVGSLEDILLSALAALGGLIEGEPVLAGAFEDFPIRPIEGTGFSLDRTG